jgi:hypothetical protein
MEEIGQEFGSQVTVRTDSGVSYRADFLTRDPATGEIGGVEAKASQTAGFTPNQRVAIPEIAQTGGTIVGAGKPGFPGGMRIPPTTFRIVRPGSEKFMTIEQTDVIDFWATKDDSPEMSLIIADHLPWDVEEAEHLWLLQCKINKYLAALESGELYEKVPKATGKHIVIVLAAKYALSKNAQYFVDRVQSLVRSYGFDFRVEYPKLVAKSKTVSRGRCEGPEGVR